MCAELILCFFYSPISGSRKKSVIFRNYTYFGIASTGKSENLGKIQKILADFRLFFQAIP
jgi:hypothetical protein